MVSVVYQIYGLSISNIWYSKCLVYQIYGLSIW